MRTASIKKPVISSIVETVTPEIARIYLATMKKNRSVNDARVARYVKDILNGQWEDATGEAIKFNTRGELIDGQHRLKAIVKAEATIELLVVRGCSDQAQSVIDSGQARTNHQSLVLAGFAVNSLETSIYTAMFSSIDHWRRTDVTKPQICELFPKYETSVRFAATTYRSRYQSARSIRSLVARAHYCGVDAKRLSYFLSILDTGAIEDQEADGIAILVRDSYLLTKPKDAARKVAAYSRYMYGLNAFLTRSSVTRLRRSDTQLWKILDFDGSGQD